MSFLNTIEKAQPVFYYNFSRNDGVYYYTNGSIPFDPISIVYNPEAISHSDINQTDRAGKRPVNITLPMVNSLAQKYLQYAPENQTSVTILKADSTESSLVVKWKGKVIAAKIDLQKGTVTLNCESLAVTMERNGLRAKFMRNCRHALYSDGCGVDENSFRTSHSVTEINGTILTIPTLLGSEVYYYTGGIIGIDGYSLR